MGTTTSRDPDPYQTSGDVNAILQGMTDATIDRQQAQRGGSRDQVLPAQVQPNYRAPLPVQLAQNAPQLPPEVQPNQPNYTVTGTGPGTWWRQQQQAQPPIPPQFQQNQQQQPVPLQPPPGLSYRPPQNSELPPVRNMPSLWNGNQVGASGQTKQQFLLGRMQHESQGDPTALNYVARGDPRMYDRGYTASGLLQDTNETWRNGVQWALADPERYPMHGDDPRKYPAAGYAPWHTQWQVNSAIYDHAGETPWREGARSPGFQQRLGGGFYNAMAEPTQQYAPAQPRSFAEWGRAPQGVGGSRPGEMPRHTDFGRIMGAVAPLLVGIASLAMRMPLSTAITAYGAMARAQQNGQQLDYQRQRTQWQDHLKEATAQQALESREAGDAFSEYGNNNPQGLQQQLAQIALKYNDPVMFRMAQNGDLNGIHQLQTRRDLGNQDLTKLHKAAEEEADRQAQDAAVQAMDRKYQQEHPDATPDDLAIAHNEHIGQAGRAGTKDPRTGGGTKPSDYKDYEWEDSQGKKHGPSSAAMVPGKGLVDSQGNPIDAKPETIRTVTASTPGPDAGPKPSDYKDYEWEDADDGQKRHGSAAIVPGKGLVDPQGKPINAKPGTINAVGTRAASAGGAGKPYDIVDSKTGQKVSGPWELKVDPDGKVSRTDGGPLEYDPQTQHLAPATGAGRSTQPRFGTTDDLMQRWHEQFVKDNNREPSTDEIARQRQEFTQEVKPPPMSARQVSQRLGIAIGEAAGGVAALTQLSSSATLGPWGGAQAALSTGVYDNFLRSLTNKVTPEQAQMMNSIAKVIARPLASLEAAGVATGLVGVTQSLQTEFPQSGDSGYTVLTKLANIRNIVDAAADMLDRDRNLDPSIKKLIADNREKVDNAIPYTLDTVVTAQANPTKENMRGLAERLLHHSPSGQRSGNLPPGVTVEVK